MRLGLVDVSIHIRGLTRMKRKPIIKDREPFAVKVSIHIRGLTRMKQHARSNYRGGTPCFNPHPGVNPDETEQFQPLESFDLFQSTSGG